MENGNIIEFLLGEKAFNGIWFGEHNGKPFWWRKHLREYINQQGSINTNVVRPESNVGGGELLQGEASEKGVSDGDVKNCIIYCMDDCECTDICKMWKTARKSS